MEQSIPKFSILSILLMSIIIMESFKFLHKEVSYSNNNLTLLLHQHHFLEQETLPRLLSIVRMPRIYSTKIRQWIHTKMRLQRKTSMWGLLHWLNFKSVGATLPRLLTVDLLHLIICRTTILTSRSFSNLITIEIPYHKHQECFPIKIILNMGVQANQFLM